jgi:hypothetical protein
MTPVTQAPFPVTLPEIISLQQLTSGLINSFTIPALRNRNLLVNNITEDLLIDSNAQVVASILSGVLSAVVSHSKNSSISLSAKLYGDVVLIHIKDYNNAIGYTIDGGWQRVQALAVKIGGFINITNQRQNVTTIAFSFPNLPMAA